jgi:hypothetical protein
MAETSDELALVHRVGRLLHAAHRDHFLVHFEEAVLGDLYVKRRSFGVKSSEGVFMKFDCEWGRAILRY